MSVDNGDNEEMDIGDDDDTMTLVKTDDDVDYEDR